MRLDTFVFAVWYVAVAGWLFTAFRRADRAAPLTIVPVWWYPALVACALLWPVTAVCGALDALARAYVRRFP